MTALSSHPATSELWRRTAGELARAIVAREVSAHEVVVAHLERIARVNPAVGALTHVDADEALAAAAAADDSTVRGDATGPLHGVPFSVKSNIDVRGVATTCGVPSLIDVAEVDAPVVERMRRAGAIVLAQSNMPDLGTRWHTESSLHGATVNPWDPSRTPGGSSGGAGVACATGMAPLGLGNDGGGSLRFPALCSGVAALKPTTGRIPSANGPGQLESAVKQLVNVQGLMARCVEDLRVGLAISAGPHPRDPFCVSAPLEGVRPEPPVAVSVVVDDGGGALDPRVVRGVERAARVLALAGYRLDDDIPPTIEAAEVWLGLSRSGIQDRWETTRSVMGEAARAFTEVFLAGDPVTSTTDPWRLLEARYAVAQRWSAFQSGTPLVLTPVSAQLPFEVGADLDPSGLPDLILSQRFLVMVNALGLPAVVVPVGVDGGLPIAVQIVGPRYREDLCLLAAHVIERAVGPVTPIDPRIAATSSFDPATTRPTASGDPGGDIM